MSQMTNSVCELLPTQPRVPYELPHRPANSRTGLKRYFLDPVLPVLTLLFMSALTLFMLVTIVTTVADMDLQLPGSYVSIDPLSGWTCESAGGYYQAPETYADVAMSVAPVEDRESWPVPQTDDPF